MEYKNKLYCMDNLELMKQLPDKCINLIYCDILYNTGKKFSDYEDNLGTPQEAIQWYEPRLIEMKRLLKDTGSIYLQCDYRLVYYLKVKMDEIFGFNNFRNDIVWSYKTGGVSKHTFAKKHDNILFYTKSRNYNFNTQYYKSYQQKKYNYNAKYPEIWDEDKKLWYHNSICRDVWEDINVLGTDNNIKEKNNYDTQKPKKLLERIINASSNNGDLVADFFMGSGTTCVVAKELGRDYLGCDINQNAIDITYERLQEIR